MKAIRKSWKIYGAAGRRQKASFEPSQILDFCNGNQIRILQTECSDRTGTNDYIILRITMASEKECDRELLGQVTDGILENCRCHRIEEIALEEAWVG